MSAGFGIGGSGWRVALRKARSALSRLARNREKALAGTATLDDDLPAELSEYAQWINDWIKKAKYTKHRL